MVDGGWGLCPEVHSLSTISHQPNRSAAYDPGAMSIKLTLPQLQNWSCHNCGGCCRQHGIAITEAERDRIAKQGWTEADNVPAEWFTRQRKSLRLNHRPDGSCVFLDEKGLCRIHGKFGEAAKPLACRIYPYVFHPAGGRMTVSLRYSCPSVVENLGKTAEKSRGEIAKTAKLVVPEDAQQLPPPEVSPGEAVSWDDFRRIVDALDRTLAQDKPLAQRLREVVFWVGMIGQASLDAVRGERLGELLDVLTTAAPAELELTPESDVSAIGATQFRLLVAQYARKDTEVTRAAGWRGRLTMFKAGLAWAGGKGVATPFQDGYAEVPFDRIETGDWPLPAEADELLTRYLRTKVRGLHFCGRGYYGVPLAEGWASLALCVCSVAWLARWSALSAGREAITKDDLVRGVTTADHHHGFSDALATRASRKRVQLLTRANEVDALVRRYVA